MPWRNAYITTRKHPLALTCYLIVFLIGLLTITGPTDPASLLNLLSPVFQYIWEWSMLVGGALALIGCFWKRIDNGLFMEQTGAEISALGLLIYCACIIYVIGFSSVSWLLVVVLLVGTIYRSWQAHTDLGQLDKLALLKQTLDEVANHNAK